MDPPLLGVLTVGEGDGCEGDLLAGWEDLFEDFPWVGEVAVCSAVLDVSVEGGESLQAEASFSELADAGQGVGDRLVFGDSDVPELGDLVGDGSGPVHGELAGAFALEGFDLTADGGE